MRCDELASLVSAASFPEGDGDLVDSRAGRHVAECLRCQAEMVQYRRLARALRALRTEVLAPAPGLVADVLVALEDVGERQALRTFLGGRRVTLAGGMALAAAAAAGTGAALVVAARGRRPQARVS